MNRRIAHVALLVPDYDEAIAFYVGTLGFSLVEDTPLGGRKRWVLVRPAGPGNAALLLAEASGPLQQSRIGSQTGDRVGFFLFTDDFERDYRAMTDAGVRFLEDPRHEDYGTVAVFSDPFGNKWDLLQPAAA